MKYKINTLALFLILILIIGIAGILLIPKFIIGILAIAILILGYCYATSYIIPKQKKTLVEARKLEGYDKGKDFFRPLSEKGVPEVILFEIMRYFQKHELPIVDFPILPSDNLKDIYGMEADDVVDTVEHLVESSYRSMPETSEIIDISQIKTIEDLTLFLSKLLLEPQ